MKDFSAFMGTLDEDALVAITEKGNSLQLKVTWPITPENLNAFMTSLAAVNMMMMLELLRKYHDWLHSEEEL